MYFACKATNKETGFETEKMIIDAENEDEATRLFCNRNPRVGYDKDDEVSIEPIEEVFPTRAERSEWKKMLYNALMFLAEERSEFYPRKKDSLNTLLEAFLCWADTCNEGYFSERDEVGEDRYCTWLAQEYDSYIAGSYYECA